MTKNAKKFADLAHSYEQKGFNSKGARLYRLAAEEAAAVWANEDALTYVSRALALTSDANPTGRFQLLLLREEIFGRTGQTEPQEADLVSLSTLAHALNDDRLRSCVAARLGEYKLARGEFQDTISVVNLALRLAELAGAAQEAAALHLLWGRALLRQDKYVEARAQLQRALSLSEEREWVRETADSHRYLGVLAIETGELAEARAQYGKAQQLYHQLNDRRGESDVLNNLGNVAQAQGLLGQALGFWDQAHALYEQIGDRPGACRLLINQSAACLNMGLFEKAKRCLEAGLAASRDINLAFGEGLGLINLALVHYYNGSYQNGFETVQAALKVARRMKSPRVEGYGLNALGKILISLGDLDAAADTFWEALVLWEELEQPNLAYEARAGLARVALAGGNRPLAHHHIRPVVEYVQSGGDIEGTESPVGILLTCVEVLQEIDDRLAAALLERAHKMIQKQAADIRDEEARQSFLTQVAVNKKVLEMIEPRISNPYAVVFS